MTVKPEDIRLNPEQKRLIAEQANSNGKPWRVLAEAEEKVAPWKEER